MRRKRCVKREDFTLDEQAEEKHGHCRESVDGKRRGNEKGKEGSDGEQRKGKVERKLL